MASQVWISLSMQRSPAPITKYTSLVAHPPLTTATGMMTSALVCKCQLTGPTKPVYLILVFGSPRLDSFLLSASHTGSFKRLAPLQRAASVQTT